MNKIREYFSTLEITRGFFTALLASAFIYLSHWGLSHPLIITIFALSSLFFLLLSDVRVWFWHGVFVGVLWFWWIALSLEHYGYAWGLPFGIVLVALVQGVVFWAIAWIGQRISLWCCKDTTPYPIALFIKALGLFALSYIHPFGFDWLKPELMFIESYIGIEKWQFALVLLAICLSIAKRSMLFLLLILATHSPTTRETETPTSDIQLVTTHISVEDKWDTTKHAAQFETIFTEIDQAISQEKRLIIFPESVFPLFLGHNQPLLDMLQARARDISIVVGGLYWKEQTPHNSAYIFANNTMRVANKVLLVPFGESNPLPDFLSDWINKVFYDGAIDYVASSETVDYEIDGTTYRNAICFEATSEKLYTEDAKGHRPKNMIALSNNGWFTPSTEPTLQKLLLQYYAKKYGTTIYHSINMSESYVVRP